MLRWLKQLTVILYDLFISTFFTVAAHLSLINHMSLTSGHFLDVGCGTGKPLMAILQKLKQKSNKIVGVDMHPQYTRKAMNLFKNDQRVNIHQLDFYSIEKSINIQFSFIFFSFSFMLMPDPLKALEVAKRVLKKSEQSRISMVLTLNSNKNTFLSWFKPLIKRWTTIDFGNVVYEDELLSVIDSAGLQVTKKVRVVRRMNPFLRVSPVYYIECKPK